MPSYRVVEAGASTAEGNSGEDDPTVLLDACVVINLYATRRFVEILSDLPFRFAVADLVAAGEALYVRRGGDGEDAREPEPIGLEEAVSAGLLAVLSLETDEERATFISLAGELDDGEAATAAIARHRGHGLATDDRAARRLVGHAGVPLYSTLGLIRAWCEGRGLAVDEIAVLLSDVRMRGSFVPPRGDALRGWWDSHGGPSS